MKYLSFEESLNKIITDPKKLEEFLSELTDVQLAQCEKYLEKKMMFSTRHKFNYIKWYHRLYLWMFRTRRSIDDYRNVACSVYYKVVFGNYFIVDERSTNEIPKF